MSQMEVEFKALFNHIFLLRDKAIPATRRSDFQELIANKVLLENEKGITVDYSHDNVCTKLISLLEEHLGASLSKDIGDAFSQIEDYHSHLKSQYKHNFVNAFDFILDPLRVHILLSLQASGSLDIIDFRESLSKEKPKNLFLFDKWFYSFLVKASITSAQVLKVFEKDIDNKGNHYLYSFLREVGKRNISLAKELLSQTSDLNYPFPIIRSNLIISIHNSGKEDLFKMAIDLVSSKNQADFGTIPRLNLKKMTELEESFDLVSRESNEFWNDQVFLFCRIVENGTSTKVLREKCFLELDKLLKISKEVADISMNVISLYLEDYEEEKFKLLITYISTTKNFNVIKQFFNHYKNPKYLFSLLVSYHKAIGSMGVNRVFQEAISHFWRSNRVETEKYICDLFNPDYKLGLLPIEIILAQDGIAAEIDLLSVPEEFQFNAIDCIYHAPHSFEKLLPVLKNLQQSENENVIEHLQNVLKLLTTEAYGLLMEWLEKNIDNTNEFLEPIKEYHKEYQKYTKNKEKYDDLNPLENERELMELYYRLENEQQAKLMKKVSEGENSFMSMMKSVTIVRGKSWKLQDQSVTPLANIQHSTWIDYRRIADPISYEFMVKQFDNAS